MRATTFVAAGLLGAGLLTLGAATPASAAAFVLHPGDIPCSFEPGDVPGVDVFFPADCTIVTTDAGGTTIVGRGTLPEGFALTSTFVGTVPCFGGTGRIVATVSGQVTATCHFPG